MTTKKTKKATVAPPAPTPNERPTRPVNPPPPKVIALDAGPTPPPPAEDTQPVLREVATWAQAQLTKPHADAIRELLAATPLDLSGCVDMSPEKYQRYLKARHVAEAVLGS